MLKDIKVIFKGTKAPSGKKNETVYMVSSVRLDKLKADGKFDIEVVEEPKAPSVNKKTSKKKSSPKKGEKK